jgi:hypothetical protein
VTITNKNKVLEKLNYTLKEIKNKINELKRRNGLAEKDNKLSKIEIPADDDYIDDKFNDIENYDNLLEDIETLENTGSLKRIKVSSPPKLLNSKNNEEDCDVFFFHLYLLFYMY